MMDKKIKITDLSACEVEEIAENLYQRYLDEFRPPMTRNDIYCGITNDFDRRRGEHEQLHWEIKNVIAVVDCGTKEKAAKVEGLMGDAPYEFTITVDPELTDENPPSDGNGEVKNSTLVYMVVKGKNVNSD